MGNGEIKGYIDENRATMKMIAHDGFMALIDKAAAAMIASLRAGGKILACGNGGSAGDAQHLAGELVNRFKFDRPPLPCVALTTDTSVITAIGNDASYGEIFSKQVEALGKKGDVLVALSTSGNSPNVLRAVEAAAAGGMTTIGLLGNDGGKLKDRCAIPLVVPAVNTPRIQEAHILILHILSEMIENSMFGALK